MSATINPDLHDGTQIDCGLRPTRHKICHFGDVPKEKEKNTFTNQKNVLQRKHTKKLKSGLVASYDIRPRNGEGLFWFWHFITLSLTY